MTIKDIEHLAKKNSGKTIQELHNTLMGLKLMGLGILECIIYVRGNQQCSFMEAKEIVLNSTTWIDKKEDFIKQEEKQTAAFFNTSIKEIQKTEQHIYSSDGTTKDNVSIYK